MTMAIGPPVYRKTRKASLQATADRLAEIEKLLRKCLKLDPGWAVKPPRKRRKARA